jgi:transcriptional regulator with XRE-family HTH domain
MAYGYSIRLIEQNKEANSKLLGVRLGRVCIRKNIPVSEVASKLGVSRQTIYNWFIGSNSPQNTVANSIEKLLVSLNRI